MDVMAAGIERALEEGGDLTGESVRAGLENIQNYDTEGVSAPITFSATSHKGNNSLRLFRVENGQWVQISDYISAP
jgi:branched-chain amino acid transport system substrate-binding protein